MQRNVRLLAGLLAIAIFAAIGAPLFAQQQDKNAEKISLPVYRVRKEYNVPVPMRDGVKLSTDIYRPDAPGRFPVILERTPYDNNMKHYLERGTYYASRGYAFVVQDVRGRYDSEGEWYPLIHEAEDGYDAQEWAGTQSWSTGKVGTIGGSYGGWTQWIPAPLANKHLACMVPYVAPPNPFKNTPFENGVFLYPMVAWMLLMDGHTNQLFGYGLDDVFSTIPEVAYNLSVIQNQLPVSKMDEFAGRHIAWWKDWMEHDTYDEYWKRLGYQDHYDQIDVPAFDITGWFDGDFPGAFSNFPGMEKGAKSEFARHNQKILIGPWPHGVDETRDLAGVNFGQGSLIDLDRQVLRWFDHWLKGIDNGIENEPHVRIFVMGTDQWRDEADWPISRAVNTNYYLQSGGHANSLHGDGTLQIAAPTATESADQYNYDPLDPTPEMAAIYGPTDPSAAAQRMDVLVYQTPPLEEDTEVTGPITLKLFAASSAPDTDFFARLSDAFPDGTARGLGHGIIRVRFRESLEKPTLIEPGKIYEYTIELWPTSNVFRKGHRIRIDVASAAFPSFGRNLNTGKNNQTTTETQVAHQTIYHDAAHPTRLILPIMPASQAQAASNHAMSQEGK